MINVFKSIVRTVIIYGYTVLLTADQKVWDRLQIMQNKAIRAALGFTHIHIGQIHSSDQQHPQDQGLRCRTSETSSTTNNSDITLKNHLVHILEKI